MQYDFYAFRQNELNIVFSELEQVFATLIKAKDKQTREEAKKKVEQSVRSTVTIEPHLAYLWFWARKEEAREEESKRASEVANSIRDAWNKGLQISPIPEDFHLVPDVSIINHMPPFSFMLFIPFQLQKPYMSRDEKEFHLLDNPLRKEKIFQVPMVAATSWKGALRAALWQLGYREDNEITVRLLGNPRDSSEHQAGRLYFYPTFFDKIGEIGLEVINPHSRDTGVDARGPILMECVPRGVGALLLLYVPFGPIEQGEDKRRAEVARDMEVLADGVQAMLTTYGFGAKTSSGFGITQNRLAGEGKLALRAELSGVATPACASSGPERPVPVLPRYLVSPSLLHPDFCHPDGSVKSEVEYQAIVKSWGKKYTKKDSQLYSKAKNWWEREGQHLEETASKGAKPEAESTPTETPSFSEQTFSSLGEMRTLVQQAAALLKGEDEA